MKCHRLRPVLIAAWLATAGVAACAEEWNFQVLLDGKPIGEHRFTLTGSGEIRRLESRADFSVRVLGIPVYHYRHSASEVWQGDCLVGLSAETDDDGTVTQVSAYKNETGALEVIVGARTRVLPGCTMSFAYWNPAMRRKDRLLNAQTGNEDRVQIREMAQGALEGDEAPPKGRRWRINGLAAPLDIWYSARGEWLGLDSTVAGGRRLSYRLK